MDRSRIALLICVLISVSSMSCTIRKLAPNELGNTSKSRVPQEWRSVMDRAMRTYTSLDSRNILNQIRINLAAPYRYGGITRSGFDCSGFVVRVFEDTFGITLPHNSLLIYHECQPIKHSKPMVGDLLFFRTNSSTSINHVGIYIVGTKFVHASSKRGVVISDLRSEYYKNNFAGIRRFVLNPAN